MDVDGVCTHIREDGETLPLFVVPKDGNDSVSFLKEWVKSNKPWLKQKLIEHGAVMFRGFAVEEGEDFETVVQQFEPELSNEYRGVSPRKLIPGTQFVYSASELPPRSPIPQHCEMSFLPYPPRNVFFCCLDAPVSAGGETCLCDFQKVYQQMDPSVRKKFEDKGVMYYRNYHRKKTLLTDPTMLKGWEEVFDTDKKEDIEEECRKNHIDFSWAKNDDLKLVSRESAIETHPDTGKKVWFNHVQVFHWSMIWDELYRVYKRVGVIKYLFLAILSYLAKFVFLNWRGGSRCGFHTSYGDGTEVDEKDARHIRDVMWKNMVFNRWRKGDIVMIDNFRISHGRQPYSGKRKVVVSWSQPRPKPSQQLRQTSS
jgi:alpha-ketoglutarate-dependent taurine dioxygenase